MRLCSYRFRIIRLRQCYPRINKVRQILTDVYALVCASGLAEEYFVAEAGSATAEDSSSVEAFIAVVHVAEASAIAAVARAASR